ncbi:MAG: glycosyl hydrolase [Clostridiaceae bacterium]|nr:glycosyl hydrolase [Clostridiaceae bacterium]
MCNSNFDLNKVEAEAMALLEKMTAEERFDLVASGDPDMPGASNTIMAIKRLGIPEINLADATGGISVNFRTAFGNTKEPTAFPCPMLLAATWNTELSRAYARAVGEECRACGIHFLLGPGINIYRSSANGRNFEYMGEDPYLTASMASSYVESMQSTGVAACAKHFICNNEEYKRRGCNVIVDERTLHEIYLPGFKAAVDAGVLGIMTAYNQLNGEWCGQSYYVVTELLKEELGFKWLCMTDWTATWDGEKVAKSGTDLEKPFGQALKKSKEKLLGTPYIDRMAFNILKTCIAAGFYKKDFKKPELYELFEEHERIAKKVNDEGIVLLKNDGILPLSISESDCRILVSGNCARRLELSGGGSAQVKGYNLVTYLDSFIEEFGEETVVYAENPTDEQIRSADCIFLFCGFAQDYRDKFYEGESRARPFDLPDDDLITRCTMLNPATVVCVVAGGGVRMDWAGKAAAIIQAFYGGQTGPKSMVDIITGRVNPSGKLPFTIECKFEDSPAYGYDKIEPNWDTPHYDIPEIKRDTFFCKEEDGSCYTYDLEYKEGVFVGYRWYESKQIKTRFPFGHGLSYTSFAYENLIIKKENDMVYVSFCVKNVGHREGAEIAQVYVQDVESSVPRPIKELKGFVKLMLQPGESKKVEIKLDRSAFSYWDPAVKAWTLEPGEFVIHVGASSSDIRLKGNIYFL